MIVHMLDLVLMDFATVIQDLKEMIVQSKFAPMVALDTVFAHLTTSLANVNLVGLDLIVL